MYLCLRVLRLRGSCWAVRHRYSGVFTGATEVPGCREAGRVAVGCERATSRGGKGGRFDDNATRSAVGSKVQARSRPIGRVLTLSSSHLCTKRDRERAGESESSRRHAQSRRFLRSTRHHHYKLNSDYRNLTLTITISTLALCHSCRFTPMYSVLITCAPLSFLPTGASARCSSCCRWHSCCCCQYSRLLRLGYQSRLLIPLLLIHPRPCPRLRRCSSRRLLGPSLHVGRRPGSQLLPWMMERGKGRRRLRTHQSGLDKGSKQQQQQEYQW